jgi:hypothetical protein
MLQNDWLQLLIGEYGPVAGYCEQNNEPSGSIRDQKFLTS